MLVAVLHFAENREDPWTIANRFKDQVAPGSYLVVSHGTADHISPAAARHTRRAYQGGLRAGGTASRGRSLGSSAGWR